jgi:glucose-6-phosphate isomerase
MNQTYLNQWQLLEQKASDESLKDLDMLFAKDKTRAADMSFEVADVFVDFSKNWIDSEVLEQLIDLANNANLDKKIKALFAGQNINVSESKPATHTAQRKKNTEKKLLEEKQQMYRVANNYTSGKWLSAFDKKINAVVNIGIGGSYLGPKLAVQALTELQVNNDIKIHFYPSVDDVALKSMLQSIDVTRTLFCISSKSLGTIETIKNTNTITELLEKTDGYKPNDNNQSFVVATANLQKAADMNIPQTHIMPFNHATGGRFSVWSSIGFPVLMAIGQEKFEKFLAGAEKVDNHFEDTAFGKNVPVLMALISIWYRNFMHLHAYAVIPYDVRIRNFPAWLQQLMMESNGKMHDINGKHLKHSSSPWLFGDHGLLSQHAFFQAFHQGNDVLPIDFIGVLDKKGASQDSSQNYLLINMLAQSAALMNGSHEGNVHNHCPGNRPSSVFLLKEISASSLGQLMALYEHMIFVQSIIWNINCFDQPGVELGKNIAREIVDHMHEGTLKEMHLDQSTEQLLTRILDDE